MGYLEPSGFSSNSLTTFSSKISNEFKEASLSLILVFDLRRTIFAVFKDSFLFVNITAKSVWTLFSSSSNSPEVYANFVLIVLVSVKYSTESSSLLTSATL